MDVRHGLWGVPVIVVGYAVPDSPSILDASTRAEHDRIAVGVMVDVAPRHIVISISGRSYALDPNHVEALILVLRGAVTEVNARAVDGPYRT